MQLQKSAVAVVPTLQSVVAQGLALQRRHGSIIKESAESCYFEDLILNLFIRNPVAHISQNKQAADLTSHGSVFTITKVSYK